MSTNPRMQARNERAKLTPRGVPAEKAAPPKASEPAAPIPLERDTSPEPKKRRRVAVKDGTDA